MCFQANEEIAIIEIVEIGDNVVEYHVNGQQVKLFNFSRNSQSKNLICILG